jgi:hypothetical protein
MDAYIEGGGMRAWLKDNKEAIEVILAILGVVGAIIVYFVNKNNGAVTVEVHKPDPKLQNEIHLLLCSLIQGLQNQLKESNTD